ncbi:tyrosyl-DNA phosphodiesterase I [Cladochytrium replicatum]|nr:tyrosyl-DNA phosphodiesterase I [Cladochytrium replicatum]
MRPEGKRAKLDSLKYPDGKIALTYVKGFSRAEYMSFEDLIDKANLRKIVISGFQLNEDWLFSKLPSNISICLVRPESGFPSSMIDQKNPKVLRVFPHETAQGCMHAKIMVLVFDSFVRIVIGSANVVPYDYELLENILFIQDFPLLTEAQRTRNQFSLDLEELLFGLKIPSQVVDVVRLYDYSKATATLVVSKPGKHVSDRAKWGLGRLTTVSEKILGKDMSALRIEYLGSSLGALSESWMESFYNASRGIEPSKTPAPRKKADPASTSGESGKKEQLVDVRVIYPTKQTVASSNLGPQGAGTICFSKTYWQKEGFPKRVFYDARSKRMGSLMHAKVAIGYDPKYTREVRKLFEPEQTVAAKSGVWKCVGWYYIGSANFTQSAWGSYNWTRSKELQLTIKNWELGCVFPLVVHVEATSTLQGTSDSERPSPGLESQFRLIAPHVIEPKPYSSNDQPWSTDHW